MLSTHKILLALLANPDADPLNVNVAGAIFDVDYHTSDKRKIIILKDGKWYADLEDNLGKLAVLTNAENLYSIGRVLDIISNKIEHA